MENAHYFWPEGQALPHFKQASGTLDAIDVSREPGDVKLMMTVLQGIVNRYEPRILVYDKPEDWRKKENWAQEQGLSEIVTNDYFSIIKKYKSYINGLIIYDENVPDTMNLGTTLAGFNDALLVSGRFANILTDVPYNLEVIKDLRGKFKDKFEVYDYALEKVWPQCSHRLIIGLDTTNHLAYIRDLAVAAKLIVIWLDPRDEKEAEYIRRFFKDTRPVETYYAGWWPEEGAGIKIASEHGIPTVPADYYENYTVYSGMPRIFDIPEVPPKPKLENKFYIAFMVSDGDNIQYCQHAMKKDDILWPNEERGKYPISWTCSPALIDAGPQLLNYYYRTATPNDLLISGPSGLGYTDPQRWSNNQELAKYCQLTNEYFRRSGFNFIAAWNFIRDDQDHVFEENCPALVGMSIQERYPGQPMFKIIKEEMPLLTAKPRYDGNEPRVLRILTEDIEAWDGKSPMFYCPQAVSWEMGVPGINRIYQALKEKFGDKVEFVRADHLAMLFREAHNVPYNLALRSKVTSSSGNPQGITNGSFTKDGWVSGTEQEKWFCVDLEEVCLISRYVLMNAECAYMDKSLNTRDFKVMTSTDGVHWAEADTVTGNTAAWIDKKITPVEARYIKVVITNPGADNIARVQLFEAHGVKIKK